MTILLHVGHCRGLSLAEEAVGHGGKQARAVDRCVVAHFGSRHADSDVDVPPCGLGIGTRQVCGIYQAWATSRPIPGRLTLRRALRKYSPPLSHKSTSASTAASAGSRVLILAAARPIAPMKQADQPAANSCSGLVPLPGVPGDESLISKRPSELRDAPFRPPVVWALPVYSTFLRDMAIAYSCKRTVCCGYAARTPAFGSAIWLSRGIWFAAKIVRRAAVWLRSGHLGARRLQGCGPPQQIVDQRPGGPLQLSQSGLDLAALVVSPQGGDGDVDRRANRGELKLYCGFTELLDAAGAHSGAIAHEANRFAIPLGIDPVDRILEHRGGSVVIFGGDEDETVGLRDRSGPFLNRFVREGGTARRGRRCHLIEERHRKIAKIEKPRVDPFALLQMLQDPLRGLFREAALAGASNNNGNDGHVFIPCYSPKGQRSVIRGTDRLAAQAALTILHTTCAQSE